MEKITHVLAVPVTIGDREITELVFSRKPNGTDLYDVSLSNMTVGQMLVVGGKMCGEPPVVMKKLDGEDVFAVVEIVSDFLGLSQKTGG